ncbi:MAG: AAA family ATPase [Kyrpidia sp.]|nr:AAA family ATPase [Kyrpidia sp.]
MIGAMGVGKTTTARLLEQQYGYRCYSLAEPVRRVAEAAFPWLASEPKSVRRIYLQRTGRLLRAFQPNPILYHAEAALRAASAPLVIDDGRTVEEAEWAGRHGLAVVVLTCDERERRRRLIERDGTLPDPRTFQDRTEREWRKADAPRVDTTHLSPDEVAKAVLELI